MCICDCNVNVWWVCGDGAHRKTSKSLCFVIVYLVCARSFSFSVCLSLCVREFTRDCFSSISSSFSVGPFILICVLCTFLHLLLLSRNHLHAFSHIFISHNMCAPFFFFYPKWLRASCICVCIFFPLFLPLFLFHAFGASLHFQFSKDLKFPNFFHLMFK